MFQFKSEIADYFWPVGGNGNKLTNEHTADTQYPQLFSLYGKLPSAQFNPSSNFGLYQLPREISDPISC